MIPILFAGNETSFTSNGLGRLNDIISCTVTEERNGVYEVEFEYPITGKYYQTMVGMIEAYAIGNRANSGIIGCIHNDFHDIQPFDLYAMSAPINGVVTFNAHHISYRLGEMVVEPFESGSVAGVIALLPGKIAGTNNFTFWTDKTTEGSFSIDHPENVRSLLGGDEGSILDVYGSGEYEFDKFDVKLYASRGSDTGLTIRYGKNMTDITREVDASGHYNAVAPYWKGSVTNESTNESEDVVVFLDSIYVQPSSGFSNTTPIVKPLDLSSEFDDQPTKIQLRARALQYLTDNTPWNPTNNIKVSFVQLWQTIEYENVAALQRVSLCDRVSVYYPELGVTANNQEVIRVVYNVLLERYDEMELGKPLSSLADEMADSFRTSFESDLEEAKRLMVTDSMMQAAIEHATDRITGGLGGYVVLNYNADGQPEELLIMNTPSISTATKVWRFNQNGLGFSTSYNGNYTIALTDTGAINASMITTGTLNANIIKAGVISDVAGKNSWNLVSGALVTNNMTANDIQATGSFSCGNSTISIEMVDGIIRGYYGNTLYGQIKIATNVPYYERGVYKGQKSGIRIVSRDIIFLTAPLLAVSAYESSAYEANVGLTNEFQQDIVVAIRDNGSGGVQWSYGVFKLNFVNGLCVSSYQVYPGF